MDPATAKDHWSRCNTTYSCNCRCLCLRFFSVPHVRSGFSMVLCASGLGMGVGRFSWQLWAVRVLAMPDGGLDTTRRVEFVCEVPHGASVLRQRAPGVAIGVFIDCCCVPDRVEVTRRVISAMQELVSSDQGVEFWPWIVEATELPPWEESLSPASTVTRLLAGGSWEFPEGPCCCSFWQLASLQTLRTAGVMSGWGLHGGIVRYRCSTLRM